MEEFPYYGLSWFLYLIVTAVFLLLTAWKTRDWSKWFRIPLITFIAAMALTPGVTVPDESWWSPAAIVMIFELDQKGLSGIWPSMISIITFWIFLLIATFVIRWLLIKKLKIPFKVPFKIPKLRFKRKTTLPDQPDLIDPDD